MYLRKLKNQKITLHERNANHLTKDVFAKEKDPMKLLHNASQWEIHNV